MRPERAPVGQSGLQSTDASTVRVRCLWPRRRMLFGVPRQILRNGMRQIYRFEKKKNYACADDALLADPFNEPKFDCRVHRKMAHLSVLEWALAMATLQLPPYVLEHIFNSLDCNYTPATDAYQERVAEERIAMALIVDARPTEIHRNYVHLIIEERSHQENIQLFIAVHRGYQHRGKQKE